jgi:hypothetical protein
MQFNLSPTNSTPAEGKLVWNADDGTLNLGLPGGNVNLQIGQEMVVRVKNSTVANMTNGQLVYISGVVSSRPEIELAKADTEATSSKTLGMLTEDIDAGQFGYVTTFGLVRELILPTGTYVDGDDLYLSAATAGAYTNTKPAAPNHAVWVGHVIKAHATEGIAYVQIHVGNELEELHNVSDTITSGASDNDIMQWDTASSLWAGQSISTLDHTWTWTANGIILDFDNGGIIFGDDQDATIAYFSATECLNIDLTTTADTSMCIITNGDSTTFDIDGATGRVGIGQSAATAKIGVTSSSVPALLLTTDHDGSEAAISCVSGTLDLDVADNTMKAMTFQVNYLSTGAGGAGVVAAVDASMSWLAAGSDTLLSSALMQLSTNIHVNHTEDTTAILGAGINMLSSASSASGSVEYTVYYRHISIPNLSDRFRKSAAGGGGVMGGKVSGIWISKQDRGTVNYGIVLDGTSSGSDIVFGSDQTDSIYSDDLHLILNAESATKTIGGRVITVEDDYAGGTATALLHHMSVDSSGGARTVTLPQITSSNNGTVYYIKDGDYNAATNNITVTPNASDEIEKGGNGVSGTITRNGECWTLIANYDGGTDPNWELQ